MKELFRPWNNWHSLDFDAMYLSGRFTANPWPLSRDPLYRDSLQQAERLEPMIIEAVRRFNKSRVNAMLKRNDNDRNILEVNGFQTILEGKRLLRPLFRMTEFNLISAVPPQGVSGLGPFGSPQGTVTDIVIPASFFLNIGLIAGGGAAGYRGLEIDDARRFTSLGRVGKDEYPQLVRGHQLRMNGVAGRDAHFAWFVPEASHIDNDLVDQLLKRGVITPHFLAAALSVDLEAPVFLSRDREALLKFIPQEFKFKPLADQVNPNEAPRNPADDLLTTAVIVAIENVPEPDRSDKAKRFLEMLKVDDAREALASQVKVYADRVEARLADNTSGGRAEELQRLFGKVIEIRRNVLQDTVLRELDETDGRLLLPLP